MLGITSLHQMVKANIEKEYDMKMFALALVLAFAAPLAASAAQQTVGQNVEKAYHTQSDSSSGQVDQSYGFGG